MMTMDALQTIINDCNNQSKSCVKITESDGWRRLQSALDVFVFVFSHLFLGGGGVWFLQSMARELVLSAR
jgi:hypothetical protein